MLKKCDILNNNSQFSKWEKNAHYCKMTSVMAFEGVTSRLRLEDATNTVNICYTVRLLVGILQCIGGNSEEAEDFKCIFIAYCVLQSK